MVLADWKMLSGKEAGDDVGIQKIDHAVFSVMQRRPSCHLKLNQVSGDEYELKLSTHKTKRSMID